MGGFPRNQQIGYAFYVKEHERLLNHWQKRLLMSPLEGVAGARKDPVDPPPPATEMSDMVVSGDLPPMTIDSFDWTHFEHPLRIENAKWPFLGRLTFTRKRGDPPS
jgi:hypothetical protein